MKKLINHIKKLHSDNRGFSEMYVILLGIVLLFTVMFVTICSYKEVNIVYQKQNITRKYLLIMETQGGLTTAQVDELVTELTNLGVTNIDTSGTSVITSDVVVPYGHPVYLNVHGTLSLTRPTYPDMFKQVNEEVQIAFKILAESVSKK